MTQILPDITVSHDGQLLQVRIKPNARARRMILKLPVHSDMAVLTVPKRYSRAAAERFIRDQAGWLAAQFAGRTERIAFAKGVQLPIRGVYHQIIHQPGRRGTVWIESDQPTPQLCVTGAEAHLPRRVEDWLKRQARTDLESAVMGHASELGVRPKAIRIRDQKTRWGSCSAAGTLSFSWRIILAPPEISDYLAAHEVAHLRELNHSDRFWALVDDLCPDAKRSRQWLREHGPELHAYGGG